MAGNTSGRRRWRCPMCGEASLIPENADAPAACVKCMPERPVERARVSRSSSAQVAKAKSAARHSSEVESPPPQLPQTSRGVPRWLWTAVVASVAGYFLLWLPIKAQRADVAAMRESFEQTQRTFQRQMDDDTARVRDIVRTSNSAATSAPTASDFSWTNVSFREDETTSFVHAIGEIKNLSNQSFKLANFTMSAYDEGGKLLATTPFIVQNFRIGETKSFDTDFVDPEAKRLKTYRIQFENGL